MKSHEYEARFKSIKTAVSIIPVASTYPNKFRLNSEMPFQIIKKWTVEKTAE